MLKHKYCGRVSAFGALNVPTQVVKADLERAFNSAYLSKKQKSKEFPLQRLRSRICDALRLNVIYQPPVGKCVRRIEGTNKFVPEINPVWKAAPNTAYVKSMKICSLLNQVAYHGCSVNISHLLVRLSINVWTMSMRHFNGLCHKISARISKFLNGTFFKQKPEADERFEALTSNPLQSQRVPWYARYQYRSSKIGNISSLMRSKGLVLKYWAYRAIKASSVRGTGWFTPSRFNDRVRAT